MKSKIEEIFNFENFFNFLGKTAIVIISTHESKAADYLAYNYERRIPTHVYLGTKI